MTKTKTHGWELWSPWSLPHEARTGERLAFAWEARAKFATEEEARAEAERLKAIKPRVYEQAVWEHGVRTGETVWVVSARADLRKSKGNEINETGVKRLQKLLSLTEVTVRQAGSNSFTTVEEILESVGKAPTRSRRL